MYHRIIITGILLFFAIPAFTIPAGTLEPAEAGNAIYMEVLGKGGYGSVNYERMFAACYGLRPGIRIGLGSYNIRDFKGALNPDLIIPVSLNIRYGTTHSLEFGAGQTFSSIVQADPDGWQPKRVSRLSAGFMLGYRYQKVSGGFVLRAGYTPVWEFYRRFVHWGGVSFGYAF